MAPNRGGDMFRYRYYELYTFAAQQRFLHFLKRFLIWVKNSEESKRSFKSENHCKRFPIRYVYSTKTVKTYQGEGLTIECDKKQVER